MRIVIAGGSGLIGRPLTSNLIASGYEVTVLSRNPAAATEVLPAGASAHAWDGQTAAGWADLVDGADAIVSLAGENIAGTGKIPSRWTDARKRMIVESRINAGQAIVEAVRSMPNKPKLLLQASAVGYYGARGDELVTEDTKPGSDFLSETCVQWEDATAPVEEMGVRRVLARTGLVLTMEGGPLPLNVLQFKLFGGGRSGSGKQYYPWIHMFDELAALQFLLHHETAAGPFNLTAPNPVTNQEFADVLGRVLGRPSKIPAPEFVMRAALGDISTLILDGQRAVPSRLMELGFQFRYNDLFPALQELLV